MISFFNKFINKLKSKYLILKIKLKVIKKLDYKKFFEGVLWIGVFTLIFCNPQILFNLCNNLRQADDKLSLLISSCKIHSIYNSENYIMSDEVKETEKIETKKISTEFELLDEIVNKNEYINVFNQVPDTVITEDSSYVQKAYVGGVNIINYSYDRSVDYSEFIKDENIILTKKSDKIFFYNTHTSESYANSDKYQFEYSGSRRSQDANYNMLRISKTFKENLDEKGFSVIFDTTPHDYGSYTSAYQKSRITLQNAILAYGGFGICFDVHRDAIEDLDFSPEVVINGVTVAKVMFVIGAGSTDYKNPYFEDNLKLALKLQYIGEQVYPGLFRPMYIRNSVYNQDLNKYSLLIEVGASGNTIEEAENATRCLTNLLNIIYKD